MKAIELTKGFSAIVDDEDFEWLSKFRWCVRVISNGRAYARRRKYGSGPYRSEQMHRVILGLTDPKIIVDHIDGNSLNNQRSNLRICTHAQNCSNRGVDKRSKSGFKGVCWHGQMNKWRAYIVLNYRQKSLGLYDCPIEAAKAHDRGAIEFHGIFARLNFPDQQQAL